MVLMSLGGMSASAGVGEWKTYTAKRDVRDLAADTEGVVWVATSGGMFSYRFTDSTFSEYTTSDGLRTNDLTAITTDSRGTIWIGAANGFIHRYHPNTKTWEYIADIALRTDPNKRINGLQAVGDTLFILSEIGVSLYSVSKQEFIATYSRFGSGLNQFTGSITALKIFNGTLWVGTRNGLASTPIINPNPSAPESWQVYTTARGLPSSNITGIEVLNDILYVGTSAGVVYYSGSVWNSVSGTLGLNIEDISYDPGCLLCATVIPPTVAFVTSSELGAILDTDLVRLSSLTPPSALTSISIKGGVAIGTQAHGIMIYAETALVSKAPPGPPSNKFVSIAVDQRGVLWSGTGRSNGDGFMSVDGNVWRSYTVAQDARLRSNDYYKVSIGKDNAKWVSSWGSGIALLDDGGTVRRVFNTTNGLPPTAAQGDPFIVVGGIATDQDGVTWITNRTGLGDTALTKFYSDSSLRYVVGLPMRNPANVFTDVVIDNYGTKWFANSSRFEPEPPIGFFYYNERFALPGTVNGWGKLTASDGLTSNQVKSVAVDHDGDVWVGSEQGISIILNPRSPRSQIASYHPLRDQIIQEIVVDALNNKWVATKQGVFVLSSDGTSILDQYTVGNTAGKLLDDDVASIAINHSNGTVYFGTEKGLSSVTTSSVTPNRSFNGLTFAPNPYYLPSLVPLSVSGLVAGSSLKILSIDGNLVKEIRTPGGRVGFWDGRNEKGDLVATAVYLVVAFSEDGSKVATGKVAVVRR